jgi:hypothetical protein
VFLFDSDGVGISCVSCDPTGVRPQGVFDQEDSGEGLGLVVDRPLAWVNRWLAGSIPGWTAQNLESALYQSRYLSNEGRLFFDSADALVPGIAAPTREEEVAGQMQKVGVENVYEYEPAGVGGCAGASGGCVALLSGGSSERESAFLEATPSGNDVFFLTAAPLLPQDTDTAFDVYDARTCTAESPCLSPPPPTAARCGEVGVCRPTSSTSQTFIGASGSATSSGPGNLGPVKHEVKGVKKSSKPLTRAQKLAKALKVCRKQDAHSKRKREACEAHARKLYGPQKTKKGAKAKKSASLRSPGRAGQ